MTRSTLHINAAEDAMLGRIRVHAPKPRPRCQARTAIIEDFRSYVRSKTPTEAQALVGLLASIALAETIADARATAEAAFDGLAVKLESGRTNAAAKIAVDGGRFTVDGKAANQGLQREPGGKCAP